MSWNPEKRVVITGIGVLASNGKGREEFWQSIRDGKVGYKPVTIFEPSEIFDPTQFRVNIAGEIENFDPTLYMGPKGLRSLDRTVKLAVSSAKMVIKDSQFVIDDVTTDDVGISLGCTLGSLKSIADFDYITLKEGPKYTNPAHFPNTVINSPASQICIWNNVQGFSTTISTGFTASIDAMSYGFNFLKFDRVKIVYAGGIEELCQQIFWGMHTLKFLSGSKEGDKFVNCPFDKRRNGVTFGEGACLIAMEDLEHAKKRGIPILAEVLGFGYYFDPFKIHKYNPKGPGVRAAMRAALEDADLKPDDIDYICANANSHPMADKVESEAIKDVFGKRAYDIPVSAPKSMFGECYSVGGALAATACVGAIQGNFIPPTMGYQEKDPDCDLDYVPNKSREGKLNKILLNTFGPNGSNSSMILGRYEG